MSSLKNECSPTNTFQRGYLSISSQNLIRAEFKSRWETQIEVKTYQQRENHSEFKIPNEAANPLSGFPQAGRHLKVSGEKLWKVRVKNENLRWHQNGSKMIHSILNISDSSKVTFPKSYYFFLVWSIYLTIQYIITNYCFPPSDDILEHRD